MAGKDNTEWAGGPRTAVVTGGASGIGFQVVSDLLARWPDVRCVILDIDIQNAAVQDLVSANGDRVLALDCDVASEASVDSALQAVDSWGPPVGFLVNCAAVLAVEPSLDLRFEEWRRVLSVNLDGTFLVTQRVGRRMVDTGGAVVNLSSINASFGRQERIAYNVAKGGIGSLTRTLAIEWARYSIRVNSVAPGYVMTPLLAKVIDEGRVDAAAAAALHGMNRIGQPQEISDAIIFLLSDRASFITGETLLVDGGFSVHKWIETGR